MEKLQVVITYRFWFLFGLALLLGTAGWWLGTGSLAAEIERRRATLDGLRVTPGAGAPNDKWVADLQKVGDGKEDELIETGNFLWEQQAKVMVWPSGIASLLVGVEPGQEIPQAALFEYPEEYEKLIEETEQIIEPFDELTDEGKVHLSSSGGGGGGGRGRGVGGTGGATMAGVLPFADPEVWKTFTPSSEEIWRAQEDLWLIRSLLTSMRDFNNKNGGDSIRNVKLRAIEELVLVGGNPDALTAAEADFAGYDEFGEGAEGFFGGGAAGGGGSESDLSARDVSFDIAEEVGPPTSETSLDSFEEGAAVETERRYVDDNESEPFKTRAFYIKVVMDHRYLPDFIVELSRSSFPIRIIRVHQAERNGTIYDSGTTGGSRRSSGGRSARESGRGGRTGSRIEVGMENVDSALLDPHMADITIAGLMTIYRPLTDDMRMDATASADDGGEI